MRRVMVGAIAAVTLAAVFGVAPASAQSTQGRTGVPTGDYAVSRCASNAEKDYQAQMANIWYGWSIGFYDADERIDKLQAAKDHRDDVIAGC